MNTMLIMTYLSIFFCFSAVQSLIWASAMTPPFARGLYIARLRPRNINIQCYAWWQQEQHETRDFIVASDCILYCNRHSTDGIATLVLIL